MSKVIDYAEENFQCFTGPPVAWFDLPQKGSDPVRVIYDVYALLASGERILEHSMINTFRGLKAAGGKHLYWRSNEKVSLDKINDLYRIWTRIAVLNDNLDLIVLDGEVNPEGVAIKEIESE